MTRINIIPPAELYDQHLMAEYREITMVPAALARTLKSRGGLTLDKYPQKYTLGKGHVVFFYNKGKYLEKRYKELVQELIRRGFNLDEKRKFPVKIFQNNGLYKDWAPSKEDKKIIRARLSQKIALKPAWYKKS